MLLGSSRSYLEYLMCAPGCSVLRMHKQVAAVSSLSIYTFQQIFFFLDKLENYLLSAFFI